MGHRIALIEGKLLLFDDSTKLAVGARIAEGTNRPSGFSYLTAININDEHEATDNKALLKTLHINT